VAGWTLDRPLGRRLVSLSFDLFQHHAGIGQALADVLDVVLRIRGEQLGKHRLMGRRAALVAMSELFPCVLDLGDGRHSVVDSSLRGAAYARGGALEAANAYCAQRSQKAVVEQFDDNRVPDDLATSSVVFRCR